MGFLFWYLAVAGVLVGGLLLVIAALAFTNAVAPGQNLNPQPATNPAVVDSPPATTTRFTLGLPTVMTIGKVLLAALAAIAILAGAVWFVQLLRAPGQIPGEAALWYILVGFALVVGLIILNRRAIFSAPVAGAALSISLPAKGSVPAQILTSMLAFALLFFALWEVSPNAELFTTLEGWVIIFVYCVAITVLALVALNLKGWARIAPGIALFIFFWLTGFYTWMLLNSDGVFEQRTHIAATLSKVFSHNPAVATSTGSFQEVTLAPNIISDINPNGARKLQIKHPNQCIYLQRAQWTRDIQWYGPYCDDGRSENAPNDIEFAASATTDSAIILVRSY